MWQKSSNMLDNKMSEIKQMVCSLIHSIKTQKFGHWCITHNIKFSYLLCGAEARQHQKNIYNNNAKLFCPEEMGWLYPKLTITTVSDRLLRKKKIILESHRSPVSTPG